MSEYFISAIDTDAGKSIATGLLARFLHQKGKSVITFKPAQTGCEGIAEDILTHRKLAGMNVLPEDQSGETCPYVFPVPASPHLSAEMADSRIDAVKIDACLENLRAKYDNILIEGAGGLMVPLNRDLLFVDWAAKHNLPLILVTSGRLGSINHTLLSLDAATARGIKVAGIIYNLYPQGEPHITTDSLKVISEYTSAPVIEIPEIIGYDIPEIDFSPILGDSL